MSALEELQEKLHRQVDGARSSRRNFIVTAATKPEFEVAILLTGVMKYVDAKCGDSNPLDQLVQCAVHMELSRVIDEIIQERNGAQ